MLNIHLVNNKAFIINMTQQIICASDHAGIDLRLYLQNMAENWGYTIMDLGPNQAESVDYPDYADKLAHVMKKSTDKIGL